MAWYPDATKYELQPESDGQPAIRPTQFGHAQHRRPVDRAADLRVPAGRPERLLGAALLQVYRCSTQEFRAVPELPEAVVARGAQQAADALAARLGGVGTASVVMINGQGEPGVVSLLTDGAHAPLACQHLRVTPARQPVQRLALRVPRAASAVALETVLGAGVPVEHVQVKPDKAGAALLLTPLVPVGRLGFPPVRQRSQLAPHVPSPVVARAQPLADVLPRATAELASPGLRGRAGVDAARGPRARISVTLPPLVMHGAPPPRAHAYAAVAVLDIAGEFVHAVSPKRMCLNQKEAP